MSEDDLRRAAKDVLKMDLASLSERERSVLDHYIERRPITHDTNKEFDSHATFGHRLADKVASFGGSWTFISLFALVLLTWIGINSLALSRSGNAFDPFPYILLNLFLSMLAAIQAPIILMSQNRQSVKDRLDAAHDYQVNLKSELEILSLHEKIDELRENKWSELIRIQQQQIDLLTRLLEKKGA